MTKIKREFDKSPLPIYGDVKWRLDSEAAHMLLIAGTGAGKTMLLSYLVAMLLKRGAVVDVIDAKNTNFGATCKAAGLKVAITSDEILELLQGLVLAMENRYKRYFSNADINLDSNFTNFGLRPVVLVWDEVLAAVVAMEKDQKQEAIRCLNQLALKARMAGYGLLCLTSQKLLASDLPRSVTEQLGTRIIMGSRVSEESLEMVVGTRSNGLLSPYRGGVGKGLALTPKTGVTYFEAPYMDFEGVNFVSLLEGLRNGKKVD